MQITIRMDDITPDMDWTKFNRFKEILDKHSVKPLIGVVPDNKDPKLQIDPKREDFWDYVKTLEKDGWTIAMHGFNHLYTTREAGLFPIGGKSEFAGVSMSAQDDMIREGKRILKSHGIRTDIFMAPSHSFDKNTIKVLKKNGFSKITDGFGNMPFSRFGMTFYPLAFKKSMAIKSGKKGIETLVYHTNTMEDKDFVAFDKLMDEAQVVSFSRLFSLNPVKKGLFAAFGDALLARSKYNLGRLRKLIKHK